MHGSVEDASHSDCDSRQQMQDLHSSSCWADDEVQRQLDAAILVEAWLSFRALAAAADADTVAWNYSLMEAAERRVCRTQRDHCDHTEVDKVVVELRQDLSTTGKHFREQHEAQAGCLRAKNAVELDRKRCIAGYDDVAAGMKGMRSRSRQKSRGLNVTRQKHFGKRVDGEGDSVMLL